MFEWECSFSQQDRTHHGHKYTTHIDYIICLSNLTLGYDIYNLKNIFLVYLKIYATRTQKLIFEVGSQFLCN